MTMNRLKQAVGHTKDVANLPPRLLEMYSEFITKNAGAVGQVEGALRSLTYIIPGMLWTCNLLRDITYVLAYNY
jgi:peroxin-16